MPIEFTYILPDCFEYLEALDLAPFSLIVLQLLCNLMLLLSEVGHRHHHQAHKTLAKIPNQKFEHFSRFSIFIFMFFLAIWVDGLWLIWI